ncbi:MAG: MBL fold metallo-hydrolase [Corynebacteriales bacterium]|nr:MBL fold metallo-hydrolase [Mycobacteriales bacterium]
MVTENGASLTRVHDLRLLLPALGAWLCATVLIGGSTNNTIYVAILCCLIAGFLSGANRADWFRGRGPERFPLDSMVWCCAAVCAGVAIAAMGCATALHVRDTSPARGAIGKGSVGIVVRPTSDPRPISSLHGQPRYVLEAQLDSIRVGASGEKGNGRLLVVATGAKWASITPGQRVACRGLLSKPLEPGLIAAVVRTRSAPRSLGKPPWFQSLAQDARAAGRGAATRSVPGPAAGLITALAVGDRAALSPETAADFRASGLSHLSAVSGANVAIVVGAVLLGLRALRAPPLVCSVAAGIALVGFVVLARPEPSVLRAATMAAVALLALALGRPRAALPALGFTVLALVTYDPALSRDIGFALSVCATAGLVCWASPWSRWLRGRGLPAGLAEALAVAAAAQLACTPLLVALGEGLNFVAVLATVAVAPAVPPITMLGVLTTLVAPASSTLAQLSAWCAGWFARWILFVADNAAEVSHPVPWPNGAVGALWIVLLICVGVTFTCYRPLRPYALLVAVILVLGLLPIILFRAATGVGEWRILACDVGQGDALLIRVDDQSAIVIDVGPDPELIDRCLRDAKIDRIPLLVLTHSHQDHVGGIAGATRSREVGATVTGLGQTVHGSVTRVGTGWRTRVGPVELEALAPASPMAGTHSDANNNSLVLRARMPGLTALFTGDVEIDAQRALLDADAPLRADVLKVPHHGSAFVLPEFLAEVRPKVALVSVGEHNRYGHPSQLAMGTLRSLGAKVLRTDQWGHCLVSIDRRTGLTVAGRAR